MPMTTMTDPTAASEPPGSSLIGCGCIGRPP
jgi:hypothetical protein